MAAAEGVDRSGSADADSASERDRRGCTALGLGASRLAARRTGERFLFGRENLENYYEVLTSTLDFDIFIQFFFQNSTHLAKTESPPSCTRLHSSPVTAGETDTESPEQFSSRRKSPGRRGFSREPADYRRASPDPTARSTEQSSTGKALSRTLAAAAAGRSWTVFETAPSSEPIERP